MHGTRNLTLGLAAALLLQACNSRGLSIPAAAAADPTPQADGATVDGASGALAAELLLAADSATGIADDDLARAVERMALDHLRSETLGGDAGPPLLGSALVTRLAAQPGAPRDRDGDGNNKGESLHDELARVAALAGAALPADLGLAALPWQQRSSVLLAGTPYRTLDPGQHEVLLEHTGGFLRARGLAAQRLLAGAAGADDRRLALYLLLQVEAAEETLFANLFTNGGPLRGLEDPGHYDPGAEPRWLPATVHVDVAATGALGFRAVDGAGDLLALAAVAQASAELVLATQPGAPLADVFAGQPYKRPAPAPSNEPPPPTWDQDIGPLLMFRCGGCHSGVGERDFVIDSYAQMLQGGLRTRALNLPMVVPGDHDASFLHEVLAGPRAPFQLMPLFSPLPAAEIAAVDDWIDRGAHEAPPLPPPPPRLGEDLARVAFANLVALHLEPVRGALHHRREADGGSGLATAAATGHALAALAALDQALPTASLGGLTPHDALALAADFAVAQLLLASGQAIDEQPVDGAGPATATDLRGQAALCQGLLAAAGQLPRLRDAARLAAGRLLNAYRDPATGWFTSTPGGSGARYDDATLADLLAALRLAEEFAVAGAAAARDQLLTRLLPALSHGRWQDDGLPHPPDRLPLLAASVVVGAPSIEPAPVTWSRHVRPLLQQKCGECHLGGNRQGNYSLDTRRLVATPGDSGGAMPLLVPGSAAASLLWQKVTQRRPALGAAMPLQRPPLDGRALELLRQWIEAGATSR